MECPVCKDELNARIKGKDEIIIYSSGHVDVDFECANGHTYFARINQDDLMKN